jgi:hypothetical protein
VKIGFSLKKEFVVRPKQKKKFNSVKMDCHRKKIVVRAIEKNLLPWQFFKIP